MKKAWCYISGPYSKGDVGQNVNWAMQQWAYLFRQHGHAMVPICPHWSHFQHLSDPMPYDDWIRYDLDLIEVLHASGPGCVFRIEGESEGADLECRLARRLGIPVFTADNDLSRWVDGLHRA